MFQNLKLKIDAEPEPVSGALQMALTVRLRIFAVEKIEPAAADFLSEFSARLDRVRARRHAVDFEAAKAWVWWQDRRTQELLTSGLEALAADPEIERLRAEEAIEKIVFEQFASEMLEALIRRRFADIELQMQSLRNNRLNVQ